MRHDSLYAALVLGTAALTSTALHAQELAADGPTPESAVMTPAKPDPVASAAKVSNALQNEKDVPAADITVSTHAATVVLTGKVDTETQKAAVTNIAQKAAEGTRVSNNLEVRSPEERPLKDQQAMQQSAVAVRDVEAALKADTRTSNLGITVSGTQDTVVLQGLVPTREDRALVQAVAGKVKGVTRVDNRVTVPN
ncbi:MAG: BON domain-containing protein [Steroidobacteraceae bacterium]